MKNLILFTVLMLFAGSLSAQTFKFPYYIEKAADLKIKYTNSEIIITDKTITIKNFNNGGKSDQVMNIDKIVQKEYDSAMCTWYYCTDAKKDMGVYRKDICIYDKLDRSFYYVNFDQEINAYWYCFKL